MMHNHYGVLAGLSQKHQAYPSPFEVGAEFATAIAREINEEGVFSAVVIPMPKELADRLPDLYRYGDKTHTFAPPWYDRSFKLEAELAPIFKQLARQHGVKLFIVTEGIWEVPGLSTYLPPAYSYSVLTKNLGTADAAFTTFSVRCLAFGLERVKLENVCPTLVNHVVMKDYKGPEGADLPLPRVAEITLNLRHLLDVRAKAAGAAMTPKHVREARKAAQSGKEKAGTAN